MKKELESKILKVLILLLILLAIRAVFVIMNAKKKTRRAVKQKEAEIVSTAYLQEEKVLVDKQKILDHAKQLKWVRDPFGVGSATVISRVYKRKQGLLLEGIIWEEANPLAIINGAIVREGEIVDDSEVIKINPDNVILRKEGKDYKLFVGD